MRRYLILPLILLVGCNKDSKLREAVAVKSGTVEFPASEVKLSAALVIDGADGLTIRGNGARLRMNFEGDAAIIIRNSKNVRLENLTLVGNREGQDRRFELPPSDRAMAQFNKNNGVLVMNSQGVTLSKLTIREVVSYAVLVNASKQTQIEEVLVGDSGSLDAKGHNNATGGILLEEGCEDFLVRACKLRNVRGNGIWTHSMLRSRRNSKGIIEDNDIRYVGRDALQAGHAVDVKIRNNIGAFVGFPVEIVDVEHGAVPVAVDTAGNVENSLYEANMFEEVNGKCLDLDGFHDGEVKRNECLNRRDAGDYPVGHYGIVFNNSNPDMQSRNVKVLSNTMEGFRFGGVFVIGENHEIRDNVFRRVNLAHCNDNLAAGCLYKADEPDLLQTGIYLGKGAERPAPARGVVIEGNTVQGFKMSQHCIGFAPGVPKAGNKIGSNKCSD